MLRSPASRLGFALILVGLLISSALMARVDHAGERDESLRAYRDAVKEGIGSYGEVLVDVRSPQEFSGELVSPPRYEQEGAQRAGHIPTAQSIPWAQAVRDDGTFKP